MIEIKNALSVFDGPSTAYLALKDAGIKVENYFSSEIDKYAIAVSKYNFPEIKRLGDITKWREWNLPKIDLLVGGSPCQGFSLAGKQLNFEDKRSRLFFEFIDILKNLKPKYFILENVKMKKEYQDEISAVIGIEPILINSALVSAQNRQRLYWTNMPGIKQPQDKGIFLKDILEDRVNEKYYPPHKLQMKYRGGNQLNHSYKSQANTIHDLNGKSGTLCAGTHGYSNGYVSGLIHIAYVLMKGNESIKRVYHPDGKCPTLTTMGGEHREPKILEDITTKRFRKLTPLEC